MAIRVRSKQAPSPAGEAGDLARLLETEARLDELLRYARDEAARIVADARAEGVTREAALAARLEADARSLEVSVEAEYRRRAAETAVAADREADRLDGVAPERIALLSEYVVSRVIGAAR